MPWTRAICGWKRHSLLKPDVTGRMGQRKHWIVRLMMMMSSNPSGFKKWSQIQRDQHTWSQDLPADTPTAEPHTRTVMWLRWSLVTWKYSWMQSQLESVDVLSVWQSSVRTPIGVQNTTSSTRVILRTTPHSTAAMDPQRLHNNNLYQLYQLYRNCRHLYHGYRHLNSIPGHRTIQRTHSPWMTRSWIWTWD